MRFLAGILLILALASPALAFDSNNPGIAAGVTGGNCTAGQFVTGINSSGLPTCQTPAGTLPGGNVPQIIGFSALNVAESETVSGDGAFSRLGANSYLLTVTRINGLTPGGSCGANTFVNVISASGVPTCAALPVASSVPNGSPPQIVGYSAANTPESETVSGGPGNCGYTRTGLNAYQLTCPGYAPLASPTFTGTVTVPDASTITSVGYNNIKALGIGAVAGYSADATPSQLAIDNAASLTTSPRVVMWNENTSSTTAQLQIRLNTGTGGSIYPTDLEAFGPAYSASALPASSAALLTSEPNGLTVGSYTVPNTLRFQFGGTNLATMSSATNSMNFSNTSSASITWGTPATPTASILAYGAGPGFYASAGSHYNGTNWVADSTSQGTFNLSGSGASFLFNSGLTVGNTYTPTGVATIDSAGMHLTPSGSGYYVPGRSGPLWAQGTWTPILEFGGATTGITYQGGFPYGYYFRMGPIVFVQWGIWLSSKGSATGNATMCGLPYAVSNNGSNSGLFPIVNFGSLTGLGNYTPNIGWGGSGQTCVGFEWSSIASGGAIGNMANSHFTGTDNIQGSFTYATDSW